MNQENAFFSKTKCTHCGAKSDMCIYIHMYVYIYMCGVKKMSFTSKTFINVECFAHNFCFLFEDVGIDF